MKLRNDSEILDQWAIVKTERSTTEAVWTRTEQYFRPDPTGNLLNSAGVWAVGVAISALFAYVTPPNTYWFMAIPNDPRDAEDPNVRRWLFQERNAVFDWLTQGRLGFYGLLPAFYRQLVTAGLGVMCTEWSAADFHVFGRPYREFFPLYDAYGKLIACYREYNLTQYQAELQFRERLPPNARTDRAHMAKLTFMQCIYEDEETGRWTSKHFFNDKVIATGFFFEEPWILPRWALIEPTDTYPTSPAQETVGDVAMLQAMERVHLRAAQKAVDPTIMAYRAAAKLKGVALDPGVIIPSSLTFSATKRPEFEPMPTGDPRITEADLARVEQRVERSFLIDVMRTLTGRGDASPLKAAEAIGRRQEGLAAISPITMRIAEEWLTPLCQRIHNERLRQRVVPPPPDGLSGPLRWTFTSSAALAVRASEVDAISTFLSRIAPVVQINPQSAQALNTYKIMDQLREYSGVNPDFMQPPDEYAQDKQMEAQLSQAQALAPAAKDTSTALVNLQQAGIL